MTSCSDQQGQLGAEPAVEIENSIGSGTNSEEERHVFTDCTLEKDARIPVRSAIQSAMTRNVLRMGMGNVHGGIALMHHRHIEGVMILGVMPGYSNYRLVDLWGFG